MKRFTFSLQSVLNLREQEESDAKLSLAEKEGELVSCNQELENIKSDLNKFQAKEKANRKASQSAIELRYSVSWRHKIKKDISQKLSEIEEVKIDIDVARKKLIEATKKRKGLEILRENKLDKWKKAANREEQLFLDELSQNSFIRGMKRD